ncbi:MAG TPA: ABC transporter permease, partial [Gemmatimonadales bacterium]|nr:ABC transporter permease [Gemmatimonadales bacterium]
MGTSWRPLAEGVVLAADAMRSSKLRSTLTILGVVIGVTTVMVMASLVDGVRTQIFNTMQNASPSTFYVMRFFSSVPLNPENLPAEVRIRPVLSERDAEAIARSDEVRYAGLWAQIFQRLEYQGVHTQAVVIYGADNSFLEANGGTLLSGRFFSQGEISGGRPVMVLEDEVARHLFGRLDPLGRVQRVGGKAFT